MPVGATIAGLLGIQALSRFGWSALFLVGGVVPLAATGLLAWLLPESPRYLARHRARWPELVDLLRRMGQTVAPDSTFVDTTEKVTQDRRVGVLFGSELRRDTLALWGSFYSCLLAVYLGFSWLPSLLSGVGFDAATSSSGITFFNLGGVVGAIAGGLAISRVGSRLAMLSMAGGAIAGALVLSVMTIERGSGVLPILAMLGVTGGLVNAVQTTMYALATNVYPNSVRATGVGAAVAIGRLGSITSGYAGAWAIDYHGAHAFFALMAAAMTACFFALAGVRRHIPAKP
jgi:AAHS family 4-hydroxybenzoate transporter-like MFS transporter